MQVSSASGQQHSRRRPCPSPCARLWDRLLGAAEARQRCESSKGQSDIRPHFTFTPRPIGDDHLRASFENAVIFDGLQVSTDFSLPVDASSKEQNARHKSIRSIQRSRISPQVVGEVIGFGPSDINGSDNVLEIVPLYGSRKKMQSHPIRVQASKLPPSDLPLLKEKARVTSSDIAFSRHDIPLRERLRADRETADSRKSQHHSGSYRLPVASLSTPERRRLSKTTNNASRSPPRPNSDLPKRSEQNPNFQVNTQNLSQFASPDKTEKDIIPKGGNFYRPKRKGRHKSRRLRSATTDARATQKKAGVIEEIVVDEGSVLDCDTASQSRNRKSRSSKKKKLDSNDVLWITRFSEDRPTPRERNSVLDEGVKDLDDDVSTREFNWSHEEESILDHGGGDSEPGSKKNFENSTLPTDTIRGNSVLGRNIECHLINCTTTAHTDSDSDVPLHSNSKDNCVLATANCKRLRHNMSHLGYEDQEEHEDDTPIAQLFGLRDTQIPQNPGYRGFCKKFSSKNFDDLCSPADDDDTLEGHLSPPKLSSDTSHKQKVPQPRATNTYTSKQKMGYLHTFGNIAGVGTHLVPDSWENLHSRGVTLAPCEISDGNITSSNDASVIAVDTNKDASKNISHCVSYSYNVGGKTKASPYLSALGHRKSDAGIFFGIASSSADDKPDDGSGPISHSLRENNIGNDHIEEALRNGALARMKMANGVVIKPGIQTVCNKLSAISPVDDGNQVDPVLSPSEAFCSPIPNSDGLTASLGAANDKSLRIGKPEANKSALTLKEYDSEGRVVGSFDDAVLNSLNPEDSSQANCLIQNCNTVCTKEDLHETLCLNISPKQCQYQTDVPVSKCLGDGDKRQTSGHAFEASKVARASKQSGKKLKGATTLNKTDVNAVGTVGQKSLRRICSSGTSADSVENANLKQNILNPATSNEQHLQSGGSLRPNANKADGKDLSNASTAPGSLLEPDSALNPEDATDITAVPRSTQLPFGLGQNFDSPVPANRPIEVKASVDGDQSSAVVVSDQQPVSNIDIQSRNKNKSNLVPRRSAPVMLDAAKLTAKLMQIPRKMPNNDKIYQLGADKCKGKGHGAREKLPTKTATKYITQPLGKEFIEDIGRSPGRNSIPKRMYQNMEPPPQQKPRKRRLSDDAQTQKVSDAIGFAETTPKLAHLAFGVNCDGLVTSPAKKRPRTMTTASGTSMAASWTGLKLDLLPTFLIPLRLCVMKNATVDASSRMVQFRNNAMVEKKVTEIEKSACVGEITDLPESSRSARIARQDNQTIPSKESKIGQEKIEKVGLKTKGCAQKELRVENKPSEVFLFDWEERKGKIPLKKRLEIPRKRLHEQKDICDVTPPSASPELSLHQKSSPVSGISEIGGTQKDMPNVQQSVLVDAVNGTTAAISENELKLPKTCLDPSGSRHSVVKRKDEKADGRKALCTRLQELENMTIVPGTDPKPLARKLRSCRAKQSDDLAKGMTESDGDILMKSLETDVTVKAVFRKIDSEDGERVSEVTVKEKEEGSLDIDGTELGRHNSNGVVETVDDVVTSALDIMSRNAAFTKRGSTCHNSGDNRLVKVRLRLRQREG